MPLYRWKLKETGSVSGLCRETGLSRLVISVLSARGCDTREKIDIKKLNAEIEEIVKRENELREAIRNIIEEIEVGV